MNRRIILTLSGPAVAFLGVLAWVWMTREYSQDHLPRFERRNASSGTSAGAGILNESGKLVWRVQVLGEVLTAEPTDEEAWTPVRGASVKVRGTEGTRVLAEGRSDDQGYLVLELDPSLKAYVAVASAAGFDEDTVAIDRHDLPRALYLERNELSPGDRLEGTVRDADSSRPIPGAAVRLEESDGKAALTGAGGEFAVELAGMKIRRSGWTLAVEKEGYAPAAIVSARPGSRYDIALFKAIRVHGVVRNTEGLPLPQVTVRLQRCLHLSPPHRTGFSQAALSSESQSNPTGSATTDAEGRYTLPFPCTPADSFLVASGEGYSRGISPCLVSASGQSPPPQDLVFDFVLKPGLVLKGRVENTEGQGVAGAEIAMDPPSSDPGWHTENIFAQTDSNGDFEVRGLTALSYQGTATPPKTLDGYRDTEFRVNPAEQSSILIRLEPSEEGTLKVRISNRSPEQGLIHVALVPLPPQDRGSRIFTGLIEPASASVDIKARPGRYALVAYTVRGDWAEMSPTFVQGKRSLEASVALRSAATVLVTPQRQGRPVNAAGEVRIAAWVYSLGQWRALNVVKAAGSSVQTEGDRLRILAPPGKVQIRIGQGLSREVELSSGQTVDLGVVAID